MQNAGRDCGLDFVSSLGIADCGLGDVGNISAKHTLLSHKCHIFSLRSDMMHVECNTQHTVQHTQQQQQQQQKYRNN